MIVKRLAFLQSTSRHLIVLCLILSPTFGHATGAYIQDGCGAPPPVGTTVGQLWPADYRLGGWPVELVERFHFIPEYEYKFDSWWKKDGFGVDMEYTLRHIPNHPRALLLTIRYGEKMQSDQPPHLRHTIECYLIRAIRFREDDMVVRMIYARYLFEKGRTKAAMEQLDTVASLSKDDPMTNYNLGLLYLDFKDYDKSLHFARVAYALGITKPGLREALKHLGKWTPSEAENPASAPSREKKGSTESELPHPILID
jgi:tetratricopeptide (TPR) repeat protein